MSSLNLDFEGRFFHLVDLRCQCVGGCEGSAKMYEGSNPHTHLHTTLTLTYRLALTCRLTHDPHTHLHTKCIGLTYAHDQGYSRNGLHYQEKLVWQGSGRSPTLPGHAGGKRDQ